MAHQRINNLAEHAKAMKDFHVSCVVYNRNYNIMGLFRVTTKLPCMQLTLWLSSRTAMSKLQLLTHLYVVWRWWGLSFEFLIYETTIKKHLVNAVYFPSTKKKTKKKQESLILPSSTPSSFSLDSLKQLPCVSIEVCLKRNDKSKMSKSLVMWEEPFPGMSRYIVEC